MILIHIVPTLFSGGITSFNDTYFQELLVIGVTYSYLDSINNKRVNNQLIYRTIVLFVSREVSTHGMDIQQFTEKKRYGVYFSLN